MALERASLTCAVEKCYLRTQLRCLPRPIPFKTWQLICAETVPAFRYPSSCLQQGNNTAQERAARSSRVGSQAESHAFKTLDNLVSRPVWFQSEMKMFASASTKHPCAALKTVGPMAAGSRS